VKKHISDPLNPKIITELLREGLKGDRKFKLRVTSQSMAPMLKTGDHVFIKYVDVDCLHRGDLVVTERTKDPVVHRLLTLDEFGLVHTKGDNASFKDPPVHLTDILGRVVAIDDGQQVFDLTKPTWIRINRIIGTLSKWELSLLQVCHQLRQTWFQEKPLHGAIVQAGEARETGTRTAAGVLKRLIRVFFHFLIQLVVWVSKVWFLQT